MNKSLNETYILVKPSSKLYDCIKQLHELETLPPHILSVISKSKLNQRDDDSQCESSKKLFTTRQDEQFISSIRHRFKDEKTIRFSTEEVDTFAVGETHSSYLRLQDVVWIHSKLEKLRKIGTSIYLHELLSDSIVYVPEIEVVERDPELEKRCIRLKNQQSNLRYQSMTKNVDNIRIQHPEDTIAYQLKEINKQLIAVLQFIISVAAGFAFGFIGIELIIGNLDFGFRLLLGIMCALIIAIAELYFLAKQLAE